MQSTLNRSIIHEDFHHMPSGMRYDDFMKEINKAKNALVEWGFNKNEYSVIHLLSNTTDALAIQFAMLELGIGIAIPPEDMFDTPEQKQSEHWKTIDSYFREFVRHNNRFPITTTVDDRSDKIFGGAIEKSQIYGKIYMDTTEEFGIRHGHYMGDIHNQSDEDVQPWSVSPYTYAWGGFKTGSGWGYGDWKKKIKPKSFAWSDICFEITHEEMLERINSTPLDLSGKVVGVSKTMLHHNALERHVLPAIMQSGRIVDMPIPEFNLGNTFIEGIEVGGNEITKEQIYQFVAMNACNLMRRYNVDNFASPSDEALFAWLDIYNTTQGDFDRPIECLIHSEPTQEHLDWESKMNIEFIYDGDKLQYGA
jgi:hypothetical protein